MPLSLGLLTLAATDSLYIASTLDGAFRPGDLVDIGWLLAFTLVVLAAVFAQPADPRWRSIPWSSSRPAWVSSSSPT